MYLLKKISVMTIAFTMVMGLAACGGSDTGSTDNVEATDESNKKEYIIATHIVFPPFGFQNMEGEYVGIDVDLLAAIAESQGFSYELKPMTFNEALQALEAGKVDGIMSAMSITEERKEKFDFSEPYYSSGIVMAVAASNQEIKGYNDLKGKPVAVVAGTEDEAFAKSIQDKYGFNIKTFDNSIAMYKDVLLGNSEALFEDYPAIGYAITQGVELKVVSDLEQCASYGFAVAKGKNAELLEMFNKGLKEVTESGEYQVILDSYIQK